MNKKQKEFWLVVEKAKGCKDLLKGFALIQQWVAANHDEAKKIVRTKQYLDHCFSDYARNVMQAFEKLEKQNGVKK